MASPEHVTFVCPTCGVEFALARWAAERRPGNQKFCSKACTYAGRKCTKTFQKGHIDLVPASARGHSDETRKKISEGQRVNPRRGPLSPTWQGGRRTERKQAMARWEYKEWRKAIFDRDNYTCVACHERGGELHADHIKQWSKFSELRYDIDNGRTLCVDCHRLTPTWGRPKKVQGVCHG